MNRRMITGGLRVANRLALVALLGTLCGLTGCHGPSESVRADDLGIKTPYQAVLLSNGLAYYGKVESAGPRYLEMSDVYYVQTRVTQQGKEKKAANVLVKRGKELHAPDRMAINNQCIVFIEPVSPDSTVGRLIATAKRGK